MKKDISQTIELPEGFQAVLERGKLKLSKSGKSLERETEGVEVKIEGNKILIEFKDATKREKKKINSLIAHTKNMINGLEQGFEYELKIASVHFPMTVTFDGAKKKVIIKNFLGEKTPREAKVVDNVEVQVKGDTITIKSSDKEKAGQSAANIETATKIRNKDRRVFQDGIYITKKPRRELQ